MKTYGETLKEFRAREGLTQRQMAARMGVKPSTYSAVETGRLKASETFKAAVARAQATGSPLSEPRAAAPPPGIDLLLDEMEAARAELGKPMSREERAALEASPPEDVFARSVILRETMEVRSTRELLKGAEAFKRKREARGRGPGHG